MKKFLTFGFLAMFTLGMIGCSSDSSDDGGGGGGTPPATTGSISGKVIDYASGNALAGVTVHSGSKNATSAADGTYTLTDVALNNRVVVDADKTGYVSASQIVALTTTAVDLDLSLLAVAATSTQDPTADFTATVPNSPANVAIAANSLVDANGNVPSGQVTTNITPIDPALDINLMPGDMTTSAGDPIASYGAVDYEFTDASGAPLNLASGQTATIRIPVSNRTGSTPPASIPLYYYDQDQGVWVEEGTATLSTDGTYYEGSVQHFTTWNADYLYERANITGCVEDFEGNRISNAYVKMEGVNYNGRSSTYTNGDGDFTLPAMVGGQSLVVARKNNSVSNSVVTRAPAELTSCLLLGEVPLTVRLTWGASPRDLDTHVVGPNNFHIWYSNKGSLTSAPFANLDVDDTSGFGPEVFTALNLDRGTYHYAVYNFSGSHTPNITDSPTRVEVTLNGSTTIFTPAAGESATDRWWYVFDIVVEEVVTTSDDLDLNMRIVPVNTWGTTTPTASGSAQSSQYMPPKN